jgi:DNA-binding MarR family transcriptional regulator
MSMTDTPEAETSLSDDAAPGCFYRGDAYVPDESVGYLIKMAYHSLQRHIDGRMQAHDLTAMQWGPLMLLAHRKGDTAAELAREANTDTGAMTRMLDRLEAKGLIRRARSEHDRRVVHLELTAEGQRLVKLVPYALSEVLNQHLAGFTQNELDLLKRMLRRMIDNGRRAASQESSQS